MSGLARPTLSAPQTTAVCVAAAVALAALSFVLLWSLGRPPGLAPTLAELSDRTTRLEAIADRSDAAFAYPQGALCSGPADLAAHKLQARLQAEAAHDRLAAVSAKAAPGEIVQGLQAVDVALDANGQEPALRTLLRALSDIRPTLSLDRADLIAKGGYLHLHLLGRAYCTL